MLSWNYQQHDSFHDSFKLIFFYPQNSKSLLCRSPKKRVLGTVHQGSCLNKVDSWGSFSIKELIYQENINYVVFYSAQWWKVCSIWHLIDSDNKFPNNVPRRCKETYLIFHCTTVATALFDIFFLLKFLPIYSKRSIWNIQCKQLLVLFKR